MGCGKSSVGRRLSGLTGIALSIRMSLLCRRKDAASPTSFLHSGEAHFRDLEQRSLENLVGVCGIVLSTGGGLVLRPENRQTLKKIGIIAWLDAQPDVLFERAMRSGRRPLLQIGDPRTTFDELLSIRRELYKIRRTFGWTHRD
jgi:shikimate kinase